MNQYVHLTTVAFWPNDRFSILVFFPPIGQSALIFKDVLPSEPVEVGPQRESAVKRPRIVHARLSMAHAPASCLISIRAATFVEASQSLPVYARVTIDRSFDDLVFLHSFIRQEFRKIRTDNVSRKSSPSWTRANDSWLVFCEVSSVVLRATRFSLPTGETVASGRRYEFRVRKGSMRRWTI